MGALAALEVGQVVVVGGVNEMVVLVSSIHLPLRSPYLMWLVETIPAVDGVAYLQVYCPALQ